MFDNLGLLIVDSIRVGNWGLDRLSVKWILLCFPNPDNDQFPATGERNTRWRSLFLENRLAFTDFDLCQEIDRTLSHLPRAPGIYAIRHRIERLLYLGKTNDLSTRFNGGHKAFTWAWLDLYSPLELLSTRGFQYVTP
jgi:hypothetical protein